MLWHHYFIWGARGSSHPDIKGMTHFSFYHFLKNRRSNQTWQIPYNKGVTWPDIVVGVIAAILLAAGLLPPYFELWKRDGRVIGFSQFSYGLQRSMCNC